MTNLGLQARGPGPGAGASVGLGLGSLLGNSTPANPRQMQGQRPPPQQHAARAGPGTKPAANVGAAPKVAMLPPSHGAVHASMVVNSTGRMGVPAPAATAEQKKTPPPVARRTSSLSSAKKPAAARKAGTKPAGNVGGAPGRRLSPTSALISSVGDVNSLAHDSAMHGSSLNDALLINTDLSSLPGPPDDMLMSPTATGPSKSKAAYGRPGVSGGSARKTAQGRPQSGAYGFDAGDSDDDFDYQPSPGMVTLSEVPLAAKASISGRHLNKADKAGPPVPVRTSSISGNHLRPKQPKQPKSPGGGVKLFGPEHLGRQVIFSLTTRSSHPGIPCPHCAPHCAPHVAAGRRNAAVPTLLYQYHGNPLQCLSFSPCAFPSLNSSPLFFLLSLFHSLGCVTTRQCISPLPTGSGARLWRGRAPFRRAPQGRGLGWFLPALASYCLDEQPIDTRFPSCSRSSILFVCSCSILTRDSVRAPNLPTGVVRLPFCSVVRPVR